MSQFYENLSQALAYADVLNYQTINNTANVWTLGIDLSKAKRAVYYINLWTTTAGTGVLSAVLNGSANSNFTSNTNITGTNITNLTANNTATAVEIRSDQLAQFNQSYKYVRLYVSGATNYFTCSAIGLGGDGVQSPESLAQNLNSTFYTSATVCSL